MITYNKSDFKYFLGFIPSSLRCDTKTRIHECSDLIYIASSYPSRLIGVKIGRCVGAMMMRWDQLYVVRVSRITFVIWSYIPIEPRQEFGYARGVFKHVNKLFMHALCYYERSKFTRISFS